MVSAQKTLFLQFSNKAMLPCGAPSLPFWPVLPISSVWLHSFVCSHMPVSHSAGLKAGSFSNSFFIQQLCGCHLWSLPKKLATAEMKLSINGNVCCEGVQGQITNLIYACGLPGCRCAYIRAKMHIRHFISYFDGDRCSILQCGEVWPLSGEAIYVCPWNGNFIWPQNSLEHQCLFNLAVSLWHKKLKLKEK